MENGYGELLRLVPIALILLLATAVYGYFKWLNHRVGKHVKKYHKKVISLAESGDPEASFILGRMYQKGRGVSKDPLAAKEWFQKAFPGLNKEAEAGNEEAASSLYDYYHEGIIVDKDEQKALFWLNKAAELGESHSQYTLALEYKTGETLKKDAERFIYWLEKSADKGDEGDAQYLLGLCYEQGEDVPQDLEKALQWYRRAADNLVDGAEEAVERLKGK